MNETQPPGSKTTVKWSDDELKAAVDAYLGMLKSQVVGEAFTKSAINQKLRDTSLPSRNKSSVEMRMQNISAVLLGLGRPWVKGYPPLVNMGAPTKERIVSALKNSEISFFDSFVPTAHPDLLDRRVAELRSLGVTGHPAGSKNPAVVSTTRSTYVRDPHVRLWVLGQANGICEGCKQPAPFTDDAGNPFLEVHHARHLAEQGSDRTSNAVALCPNCHRRCHMSADREIFVASLYVNVPRLVAEPLSSAEPALTEAVNIFIEP